MIGKMNLWTVSYLKAINSDEESYDWWTESTSHLISSMCSSIHKCPVSSESSKLCQVKEYKLEPVAVEEWLCLWSFKGLQESLKIPGRLIWQGLLNWLKKIWVCSWFLTEESHWQSQQLYWPVSWIWPCKVAWKTSYSNRNCPWQSWSKPDSDTIRICFTAPNL